MSSSTLQAILSSHFPDIDTDLINYVEGILDNNKSDLNSADDIYDAIGDILGDITGDITLDNIKQICNELQEAIKSDGDSSEPLGQQQKVLDTPVCLSSLAEELTQIEDEISSIWMMRRESMSCVDQKKLEKAENKIKQKQEKRDQSEKPLSACVSNKEATVIQATNKKLEKLEIKGINKNMDIKLENFDISFGDKVLLSDASVTLVYGRRYGMVGRNGIGKSTLLKMISSGHLKIPSYVSVLHVEQEVVGDSTIALDSVLECDILRKRLLEEEKMILGQMNNETLQVQNSSQSSHDKIAKRLQEIYTELESIEADKAPARASVILAGLGFSTNMQKKPTREFSGGWRMRIALARALFSQPDLLLLDEPSNMLDMKAIIWLEEYLQMWKSTLLVVSHDRKFLDSVTTDILHFHSQQIESYRGNYENFRKTATERLKNQQREYEAQQLYRSHVQVFIDKYRCANSKIAAQVQSRIKLLEKLPDLKPIEKETAVVLKFPDADSLQPPVLQLDEVVFSYVPDKQVLCNVDLTGNMESRICIVGDNGSGKTTLLKLLIGELNPTSGIRHCHRNLVIGYFTQHHVDQLDMNASSVEFLATKFPGKPSEEYRRQLGCFGITGDLALQSVASLSGGQKSRVAFAAVSMLNPHFLVLDEPTNHLDVETVEALGVALQNFKGGVVLVSHDEQLIEMVCEELWLCKDKTVKSLPGGFAQYRTLVETELRAQS